MKFEMFVDTGMLLSNDKHAETHIHSSGGGSNNRGRVEA